MSNRLLICFLLFFGISAFSQDSIPAKSKITYKINASGHYISGTFSQLVSSNSLEGKLEKGRWLLQNYTSYRYNVTMNQTFENNWYQLLTVSRLSKSKRLNPTVFYHFDNNLMFRVNQRHLFGGGIGSQFSKGNHQLLFEIGPGMDITEFNGNSFVNTDKMEKTRRRTIGIVRVKNEHKLLNSKLGFSNSLFFRQSFNELSDFLLMISPKLSAKVTKNLAVTVGFDYRFENIHLVELSNFNNTVLFGLSYCSKPKKS